MASAAVTERCKKNKNLLEWLDSIILAVAVLSLVFTFAARAIRVDGHSMDPTLHDQQLLIINSLPYQPSHGDIVVIDAYTPHGQTLIKRVIGVAGDTIDIDFTTGTVYRNGEALDEPYTAEPTYTRLDMTFPVTVPEGTIFVMGDNRNNSLDSRRSDIGFVDIRDGWAKPFKNTDRRSR